MLLLTPANNPDALKFLLDPDEIKSIGVSASATGTEITTKSDLTYTVTEPMEVVATLRGLWRHKHEIETRKPGQPLLFIGTNAAGRPEFGFAQNFFDGNMIDG